MNASTVSATASRTSMATDVQTAPNPSVKLSSKPSPWFDGSILPASDADHIGRYEVRNNPLVRCPVKMRMTEAKFRYWDGSQWLQWKDGEPSIFGKHEAHQWRGLLEAK